MYQYLESNTIMLSNKNHMLWVRQITSLYKAPIGQDKVLGTFLRHIYLTMTIISMEDQGTIMVIMVEPGNWIPSLELLWQRSHSPSHLTIVLLEVRDIMERPTIPLTSIYDYYIFYYIIFLIIQIYMYKINIIQSVLSTYLGITLSKCFNLSIGDG